MLKFTVADDPRTAEVIAAKLRAALAFAPNISRAAIARACKVTAQAVSGWQRSGRIDKRHLPTLASITGTTLDWWMDGQIDSPPRSAHPDAPPTRRGTVQEQLPFYGTPLATRLLNAFAQLSDSDQDALVRDVEERAAKTQAIYRELRERESAAAGAFRPAASDHDVERKMKLRQDSRRR